MKLYGSRNIVGDMRDNSILLYNGPFQVYVNAIKNNMFPNFRQDDVTKIVADESDKEYSSNPEFMFYLTRFRNATSADLSNLNIKKLDSSFSSGLQKLLYLNLFGNSLTYLSNDFLIPFDNLNYLNLSKNNLACLPYDRLGDVKKVYVGENPDLFIPSHLFNVLWSLDEDFLY